MGLFDRKKDNVQDETTTSKESVVDTGARKAIDELKKRQREFDRRLLMLEKEKGIHAA